VSAAFDFVGTDRGPVERAAQRDATREHGVAVASKRGNWLARLPLPRLQQHHSPLVSSALLTLGWAGWHLPFFLYLPAYAAFGVGLLPGFFFALFAGAVVLTWLYNRSGGSVLAAALWHASFNFVTASPAARPGSRQP
jgi:hypothetical protein